MREEHSAVQQSGALDGVRPSLQELVALRQSVARRHAVRRGQHGAVGIAPSAVRGRGMEYAESREYVAGDDARHIDWKLSARTGHTHTKLFQAERERVTLIVADTSPRLYFGTRVRFKSVQAARAGAVAAWMAQRQGDRVGALRGSGSETPVAPAGGSRGVLKVLDALSRWYAQVPAEDGGLDAALQRSARLLRPGSRLVVLADPASVAQIPLPRWSGLAQHLEVVLLLQVDPLELAPPHGVLPFLAQGQRVELDLDSESARLRWHQAFVAPLQQLLATLPGRRIQVHVLACDDASDAWLAPVPVGEMR
ncbi:DUF58 domain-containing protein [Stenotrophomonas sp. YIM B06876]|uniref:DUF58 domain-containing protein n=1 Tax=Stenotrophomonas sp. YIM B06876 TaxID=3060211 RepID=UPI0027389D27|nr:DUF58 domain-containing protein [Stenotrophomonas sp. YIM B06876]